MEKEIEDFIYHQFLINKLKHQAEKLDNRYKAITDICNDIEKIVDDLQYDVHTLDKELK